MKIKDFSKKIAAYNETIEMVAKLIAAQAPLFVTAGMKTNLMALHQEKLRNDLGLIRVLFLGETSSGKSTIINALAEKVVVPEVSHTSTMIPTWIGQTHDFSKEGVNVNFFDYDEEKHVVGETINSKPETFDDFRCFYCYRAEDAADPERRNKPERFKNMALNESYMRIPAKPGLMSDYSLVLVDTLGNNATLADNEKAQYNMKNVDFAFVLLGQDGTITEESKTFFAGTLFNKNVSHINPEHIIFVINKIDRAASPTGSRNNCRQSIMAILKAAYANNIPMGLYDKLCSQIICLSALYNRIVKAGLYPFAPDAQRIYDIPDMESPKPEHAEIVEIVRENEKYEKRIRRTYDDEELLNDGCYADLEHVLDKVVKDMFADGTIVGNHLASPERIATAFVRDIKEKLIAFTVERQVLTDKLNSFLQVLAEIENLSENFQKETNLIVSHFPEQINLYLRNNSTAIITAFRIKAETVLASMDVSGMTRARYNSPKLLRALTVTQMQTEIVPNYNEYKNKLVSMLCDEISKHIFRPSPAGMKTRTPFATFDEQITQSINNYVTKVLDKVESINQEGAFRVSVPEIMVFEHFIEEKMHHLTLQLINDVKDVVDKQIEGVMASNLRDSIHKFGDGIRSWTRDVDYFYSKLNHAAADSFRQAIHDHISNMIIQQNFISRSMEREICSNLLTMAPFVKRLLDNYLNDVQVELRMLRERLNDFSSQQTYYREFAEKSVVLPLEKVLLDIQEDRKLIQEEGVQR